MLESLVEENELIDCVSIEPGISLLPEWEMLSDKLRRKVYYNIIGTQIYYLKKKELEWLEEQQFQDHRLGNVRSSTVTVEPVLRDAHITSISINSIKHADAPGQKKSFPNGFYGEEIAQISRFAGLSDHTKIFGLFDYCPDNDNNGQTSQLAGQICWFVTEGFLNRYPEEPLSGKDIRKFIVNQHDSAYELVFYKSEKTERWWMEIPVKKTKNPAIIACSYDDYRQASEQELPVRWIKAFQRFNLEEV
jgi:hypothetical protein